MAEAANKSDFVYKDATVVIGTDEQTEITVVFVIMRGRALAISFPRFQGGAKEITPEEMNIFFEKTPSSQMLIAVKEAWWEKQAQ